ncbi:MAG: GAF domain-containing protein [Candidatus Rokubacteria bacterium]|nr:GAF domain-containing protein [Candidatus Rokubacteria bacterium]
MPTVQGSGVARRTPGVGFALLLAALLAFGLAYLVVLLATRWLDGPWLVMPYAVPVLGAPFVVLAFVIGYACLERHRVRNDRRSAALGAVLGLAGLLSMAHIATRPDYPTGPGFDSSVSPYFLLLSYLASFAAVALAARAGDRAYRLTDRDRAAMAAVIVATAATVAGAVLALWRTLPPLVLPGDGRLSPVAIEAGAVLNGLVSVWALWAARGRYRRAREDRFAGALFVAAFLWILGLTGFLMSPDRYGVPWYLAILAQPLGVAVIFVTVIREQVWLYQQARARQRDLEALHAAGAALVGPLDLGAVAQAIATRALEVAGADGAVLFRLDPDTRTLRAISHAGRMAERLAAALGGPVGQGVAGLALAKGRAVWSPDIHDDARITLATSLREHAGRQGYVAALAVPLRIKAGEIFGALEVSFEASRSFAAAEVKRLAAYGALAAAAIENGRAFDRLAVRARHDELLQDFCRRLLEATDEGKLLDEAVGVTGPLVGADDVGLFLAEPDGRLRLVAGSGWRPGVVGAVTLTANQSVAGFAFARREWVYAEDVTLDRRFAFAAYLAEHGVVSALAMPLGVRDDPVGVLVAHYRQRHRLDEEDTRVLATVAQQVALALDRVRLYGELQANLRTLKETQAQLIQADKLTALGTLLSGMAHEMNNPLSTILMSAQLLLQRSELPPAVLHRLRAVEAECRRASKIIRDLLVFSRRQPPVRRMIDLGAVVGGAVDLHAAELERQRIRVVREVEPELPPIAADPQQLEQVFVNLVANASHAMAGARGRGTLTARVFRDGEELVAQIDDEGPGIPPEHLGRVFDPFFTTKGVGEGTGLGLSLALGIVESHGGRMKAETLPARGARLTVRLPLGAVAEPAADALAAVAQPAAGPPAGRPGTARVLVVDSESGLRGLLAEIVEGLGHAAAAAATGLEAIGCLERAAYDLVALDLRLPDISGQDVWAWIVERQPRTAARVVFMTGDALDGDTRAFLARTGRPVLTKPLGVDEVRGLFEETLGRRA